MRSTEVAARVGVQRGEDKVARFRGGDGHLHRLQVAHFTDEDHVRVFAESGAQGVLELLGVLPDFALIDDAELVVVQVFDRVLDRDDVLAALAC